MPPGLAGPIRVTFDRTGFTPPIASLDSPVVVSGTNLKTGSADPVVKVEPS
jgi:hypothetical protein